jgi:hypothetical protein
LYERDKLMHTRQDRNNRGELVFDLHPAKLLLREDGKSGEREGMAPSALQATRPEYICSSRINSKSAFIKRSSARSSCTTSNLSGCKKGRIVECLLTTMAT